MENVMMNSSWSVSWPPPELEKLKRLMKNALTGVKVIVKGIFTVLFVQSPAQRQIEEFRQSALLTRNIY